MFAAVHRVRTLPGVRAAALTTMLPYGNITSARRVMRMDEAAVAKTDPNAPEPGASGLFTAVTPGWFDAIGVRLLRGRDFTDTEAENKGSPRVVIIDDTMAKKLFPKRDALGQHLRYTLPPSDGSPNDFTIVGIVSQHRHEVLGDEVPRRIFAPLAQAYSGSVFCRCVWHGTIALRLAAMIPTVRQTLHEVDPAMPILRIEPFENIVEKNIGLWAVRFGAVLFGIFGGIALLLAVVGVYGVKAYAVARRTREIGIRMALGADRGDVFALIMKQGALQTAFALGVGFLLALGLGRVLAQMLYQVSPSDPVALIASSVMLGSAALTGLLSAGPSRDAGDPDDGSAHGIGNKQPFWLVRRSDMLAVTVEFAGRMPARRDRLEAVLHPHLAGTADDVFVGRQFLKAHRTAGMKFVRADANLGPETEFAAVGKAGRSVPIDGRGIDLAEELLRRCLRRA